MPSATSSSSACFFAQVMMLVSGLALQPNTMMHVAMTHVVYLRNPHVRFVSSAGKQTFQVKPETELHRGQQHAL